jgi:hypothetical protein
MLLNDDEVQERIESPFNLLNKLKTLTQPSKKLNIPSLPPKAEDVIADLEDKISNTVIKSKAKAIMNSAMTELEKRLPEIEKPERLAVIAREMGQVIASQNHGGGGDKLGSQIIVYAPQVQNIENYTIVDVAE